MNTFIEVCAGAGGMSSGLVSAGFFPLLLNDNNRDCCETLTKNHPGTRVVCGDMTTIDYSEFKDRVDLLCGGVPCQSFSTAGKRRGLNDPRGDLMLQFSSIIDCVNPRVWMIENVKGLMSHDKGATFQHVKNLLSRENGYRVYNQVLDSSKYGVPQRRERVFIIGVRSDIDKEYLFPIPDSQPCTLGSELFKFIPPGGCWVNLPEPQKTEYMGASLNSGGGKRGVLHRLSLDRPCLTLMCTPSQRQTERCHPTEDRPLTTRESARIQTFPDDYTFYGSITSVYRQIGNAFPVKLAKRVAESIKAVL
jgi:DNA (cytosine-5)-methyltransferase 1